MFWIDPVYFWYVFIPTLLISLGVQIYLKSTFSKYSKIENANHMTGMQVGNEIFDETSLDPVPLAPVKGNLTDHYDPGKNVVRLSEPVANKDTVSAMAVTAHELGHVQQYQTGSGLIKMRSFLLPALQFSPTISYLALLFGLIFNMTGLMWIGVFFFGMMVLFSVLTIPVEFNASNRGMQLLDDAGLLTSDEDRKGARKVLTAAGLTYIAAAVTSVLQLLYYISIIKRND